MRNSKSNGRLAGLVGFISRNLVFVEVYTLFLYPVALALFGLYHETPMIVAISVLTLFQGFFIVFKFIVDKGLKDLKKQIDLLEWEAKLLEKDKNLVGRESGLKDKETELYSLKSFLELVSRMDKEITKFSMQKADNNRFKEFSQFVVDTIYEKSNVFGIRDNDQSMFRIAIYHWSESEQALIPSFTRLPKDLVPTYHRWQRYEGNTGQAFGYKQCFAIKDLSENPTLKATVRNRPKQWDTYYRSLLSCPIMLDEEEPLGVITVSSNAEGQFESHVMELSMISLLFYRLFDYAHKTKLSFPNLSAVTAPQTSPTKP